MITAGVLFGLVFSSIIGFIIGYFVSLGKSNASSQVPYYPVEDNSSRWKPSHEQLKRLNNAIRTLKSLNEHTDAKYLQQIFDGLLLQVREG